MRCPRLFLLVLAAAASLLCTSAAGAAAQAQPAEVERAEWLRRYAVPVRTVDPADDDFSDLEPLRRVLRDRRVVILGEASHGDGTTLRAKSRLVRFLHRELGFGVLAFESGLHSVDLALRGAGTPPEILRGAERSIYRIWSGSEQARPALEYAAGTADCERPLRLVGMDAQFRARDTAYVRELEEHLARIGALDEVAWPSFARWTAQLQRNVFSDLSPRDQQQFLAALDITRARLRAHQAGAPPQLASADGFWLHLLDNLEAHVRTAWEQSMAPRERQMAENLRWLVEERFPGEKVIVWIATVYGTNHVSSIETMNPELSYQGEVSMGEHLRMAIGTDAVYTLGFTAAQGTTGTATSQTTRVLPGPGPGSLEALLAATPHEYALLDLTHLPPGGEWLRGPLLARPLGHAEQRADWTRVLDGFFFIRHMEPSTAAATARLRGARYRQDAGSPTRRTRNPPDQGRVDRPTDPPVRGTA